MGTVIDWDEVYRQETHYRQPSRKEINRMITFGPTPIMHITDLGCGKGSLAMDLAVMGFDVMAVDGSNEALQSLRYATDVLGIDKISDTLMDLEASEWGLPKTDLVICNLVIAFINNRIQFLQNIAKITDHVAIITPVQGGDPVAVESVRGLEHDLNMAGFNKMTYEAIPSKRRDVWMFLAKKDPVEIEMNSTPF